MKLLEKMINKSNVTIIIIIIISLYHFSVLNVIEKMTCESLFSFDTCKRPNQKCINDANKSVSCLGMPSGHAEFATLLTLLLYHYKYISFILCIGIIILVSLQRVIFKRHTVAQVLVGSILGFLYSYMYIANNLSYHCIFYIMAITFAMIFGILYKIEKDLQKPIPNWVDKSMISNINKKKDIPFYLKIMTILSNVFLHGNCFIDWNELEQNLDKIIENIEKSNIHFDGVVGIKTGGAIISDYVSKRLNLKNYKIKLSRVEYNCDKKPSDALNDVYQRRLLGNLGSYSICEGIDDNLEGKNVILIDEMVTTGKTMSESMNYLQNVKKVNIVYPTCVSFSPNRFTFDYDVFHTMKNTSCVWPWGYDN